MSVVRVAVPVLQGSRRFHFDKGRAWSVLEHMLLAALVGQDATATDLARRADIPQRAVVEALIRLMRAGWVQMAQKATGVEFQATRSGIEAAIEPELRAVPEPKSRWMTFVIDQISGGVFRSRELPFLHEHHVVERETKESIVWIRRPAVAFSDEFTPMLDALFHDDEKFISMDNSGDRLASRWSLVTVRDGKPEGLTPRASPILRKAIEDAASKAAKVGAHTEHSIPTHHSLSAGSTPAAYETGFTADSLILGGNEHEKALRSLLAKARHRVVIHSTFLDSDRFEELLQPIRSAAQAGAHIDILWGQDPKLATKKSSMEAARRIRDKLTSEKIENVRVAPFSTGSHCKIAIADEGSLGKFCAYIGSCNWLSTKFQSFDASVRLRDPRLIADTFSQLTELSRGENRSWTSLTSDLAALSAHCRKLPIEKSSRAKISLLLASQHSDAVLEARDACEKNLFIASHRLGNSAEAAILVPAIAATHAKNVVSEIYYGTASGTVDGTTIAEMTLDAPAGVKIRPVRKPTLHAKILSWDDDDLIITSQNWLSADPPDTKVRQEIGVHIRCPGVARIFRDRFNAAKID